MITAYIFLLLQWKSMSTLFKIYLTILSTAWMGKGFSFLNVVLQRFCNFKKVCAKVITAKLQQMYVYTLYQ
jgi:hypothetical protein